MKKLVIVTLGSNGGVDRQIADFANILRRADYECELYDLFAPQQCKNWVVRRTLNFLRQRKGGRFLALCVADMCLYFRSEKGTAVLCLLYPLIGPFNLINCLYRRYDYYYYMPDMIWRKKYVKDLFWTIFSLAAGVGFRTAHKILVPTASAHLDAVTFLDRGHHTKIERLSGIFDGEYWRNLVPEPVVRMIGRRYIFHPAGLKPSKNPLNSMRAFLELPADSDVAFVLLAPEVALKRFCKNAGLNSDKIVALGGVTEGQMKWLYQNAALVSVPSIEEGIGLPVLEAIHFEKKTVVSICSALPETARLEGIYVDPFDYRSIAQAYFSVFYDTREARVCISSMSVETLLSDFARILR